MPQRKSIKLRAFKIENAMLSQSDSGILSLLSRILTIESIAESRRMRLNEQDSDEDLLSNFEWQQHTYLFGMMLRIIPADNGGVISNDLFGQHKISITDIETGHPDQLQYKDHYYFCLNNQYLITNLSGTFNIDRFQTYLNWLVREIRPNLIELTPITKVPQGVRVSDINSIEFGNGGFAHASVSRSDPSITTRISELSQSVLTYLLNDTSTLTGISGEELVSATLHLKIKKKPESMAEADYNRVMGAITRQITNDSGITIRTKSGKKYNGEAIKVVKEIDVELTDTGRIVEEQLKQKMELFLEDLNNSNV